MSTIYLGTLAHLRGDPFQEEDALEIIPGGALWVGEDGRILGCGERRRVCQPLPADAVVVDLDDAWLLPGLVDAHLHFPQYYAVAAPNRGLLDWLEKTVFPAELAFRNPARAARAADGLVQRLLDGGVTTAVVYGSQFPEATEKLFEAARRVGLRLIAGITLMDRGAPEALLTHPSAAWRICEDLFLRYRNVPGLHYALTPRFALSCSSTLLEMCGEFKRRYPQVYLQTHINETRDEIDAVAGAFPDAVHYLDVYDRFGLLGPHTILAHDLHPREAELRRLGETGACVCHCPGSNLFLGSGLFPLRRHLRHGIPVAVGTDIGAGPHFSVWEELAEAYKVQRLQGTSLNAAQLLYLVTLGAARALGLERETGNFAPGKAADFWVLDFREDAYLRERLGRCDSLEECLFVLIHLADSRHRRPIRGHPGAVTAAATAAAPARR